MDSNTVDSESDVKAQVNECFGQVFGAKDYETLDSAVEKLQGITKQATQNTDILDALTREAIVVNLAFREAAIPQYVSLATQSGNLRENGDLDGLLDSIRARNQQFGQAIDKYKITVADVKVGVLKQFFFGPQFEKSLFECGIYNSAPDMETWLRQYSRTLGSLETIMDDLERSNTGRPAGTLMNTCELAGKAALSGIQCIMHDEPREVELLKDYVQGALKTIERIALKYAEKAGAKPFTESFFASWKGLAEERKAKHLKEIEKNQDDLYEKISDAKTNEQRAQALVEYVKFSGMYKTALEEDSDDFAELLPTFGINEKAVGRLYALFENVSK